MTVRKLFDWVKGYAKRHIFHMVILVAILVLGAIDVSQYAMIGSVFGLNKITNNDLSEHIEAYNENRESDRRELYDAIEAKGVEFTGYLDEAKMELNSRIDIVDSTIKPEKKRRQLIVKVRNAITENTDTKLTIRDLNNIAVAVIDYSYQYNLSIARVLAQMKQESEFKTRARSHARAMGLMQLIPETWEYVVLKEFEGKRADPDNIYHNIRAGCFYMSEQVLKFDTYDQALMAYNWGPHRVRELLAGDLTENDIPKETKGYVKNINEYTAVFEKYGLE